LIIIGIRQEHQVFNKVNKRKRIRCIRIGEQNSKEERIRKI
jgi:hypothetical protein